jgi:hypothetical protein
MKNLPTQQSNDVLLEQIVNQQIASNKKNKKDLIKMLKLAFLTGIALEKSRIK